MRMDENKFNKWFSAFMLIGMTVALVLATCLKYSAAQTGQVMLIVSAFGSLMGVLANVCSANGMIVTFLFGLIDVSIYAVACFMSHRLGNALLHLLYFVPMQFVGYFQWRKNGASKDKTVKARRLSARQWAMYMGLFMVGALVAYFILVQFDKSEATTFIRWAVVLDVLPLMFNIIGQLLMSTAYMEQWIFWIAVNVTSIAMWVASLHGAGDSYAVIYIIKYSFYLLNSFNGLRIWIRMSRPKDA